MEKVAPCLPAQRIPRPSSVHRHGKRERSDSPQRKADTAKGRGGDQPPGVHPSIIRHQVDANLGGGVRFGSKADVAQCHYWSLLCTPKRTFELVVGKHAIAHEPTSAEQSHNVGIELRRRRTGRWLHESGGPPVEPPKFCQSRNFRMLGAYAGRGLCCLGA